MFNFKTKSDEQIVAEIHAEFDTAQDRLLNEAESMLTELNINTESKMVNKAEKLKQLGFVNSFPVKWVKENSLVKTKEQAELIRYYKQTYPFQKFITEQELERICEKYGLVFAPTQNYIKDVPEKNIDEILSAPKLKEHDLVKNRKLLKIKQFCIGLDRKDRNKLSGVLDLSDITDHDFDRILKGGGDEVLKNKYNISGSGYVFMSAELVEEHRNELFIAAPKSHFDLTGVKKTGKFSFHKISSREVNDPIVFRYCRGGVQILSKWGLEANDADLQNEKMN